MRELVFFQKDDWDGELIKARIRFGGFAFLMRMRFSLKREFLFEVYLKEQKNIIHDFPRKNITTVYSFNKVCFYSSSSGNLIKKREYTSDKVPGTGWVQFWDDLDYAFFVGYSIWNYLIFPRLFVWPNVSLISFQEIEENNNVWQKVVISFPDTINTHSKYQTFYFNGSGDLKRIDYSPKFFHHMARASQYLSEHCRVGTESVPLKRKVYPRLKNGVVLSFPLMVWIKIIDIESGY